MLEKKIEKLRKESLRNANRQFNIGCICGDVGDNISMSMIILL